MSETTKGRPDVDQRTVKRAVIASAMGNATEWYDYGVFTSGAISATIGTVFFPGEGNAVLKSLALLAVGFIVRPFGGAFFGPLGDKLGRQKVLAITILLMSGCTFVVGVLPTYSGGYSMGIAAPIAILLLRLIQGFSTGGEYGGAATFIAEYAPTKRRGFFGSFLEMGTLAGYVLGNAVVLTVSLSLTTEQFDSWGWRIPFFIALPIGVVGLYLRSRLEDTPEFRRLEAVGEKPDKAPLRETLQHNWRMILNLIGIVLLVNIADYMLLTTMPTYFTDTLHIGDTTSNLIIIGVELVQFSILIPIGILSDRIGRKPLLLTAAIGFVVLSWPSIKLMQSGSLAWLVVGFLLVAVLLALMLAVIGSTFPAMFPTRVRYGSFAIGYNISTSLFGGTCGLVVTALIDKTGNADWPAYYLIVAALIALVPILRIPETAGVPIEQIDSADTGRKFVAVK
ncbi:MHS family proline/betaine transporter-like MFS transporter [Amycolatopsis sulphurea]|uniref:Putative proline/betaine transporter n=1 Tax=Amycolatopsis sulphurea TaxID=76022 RepID=A0A2A9FBS0_9PSEU|nr:MFS transporter [Amycolatopsis sulphurea]PFG47879.1 MHS family proline/betaine transporter-like MFS transporter [Amycolatopsis sulphurea]